MVPSKRLMPTLALAALLLLGADATKKKPKLDLGLKVETGNIPTGEGLAAPKQKTQRTESSQTPVDVSWTVVKVQHGKSFMRGPNGAVVTGPYEVQGSGSPFMTEKFTTVVRIKCPQKVNAPIELQVLDSRGNAMMEGSGTVYFRGEKTDESDYTLDWDPTPFRGPGEYQLLVKVAGNIVGTFPFRIIDKNAPKGDAGR